MLTFEQIRRNPEIKSYIEGGDAVLRAMGYTEHSFPHALRTADIAARILRELEYEPRTCELAEIAGYMHDIGNMVNRHDHAQVGAMISFNILTRLGFAPEEIAQIITAIGHHDEPTSAAVSPIAAALILSDKSDVRRSRVRNRNVESFDIHDRVNFAVQKSEIKLNPEKSAIVLRITIDTEHCPVMDYFEIFLDRMVLCRKAAAFLHLSFELLINNARLL